MNTNNSIRPAAVAGTFYPSDPALLLNMVNGFISAQQSDNRKTIATSPTGHKNIRALIVPHAGYIYSGAIAASAYSLLASLKEDIRRVVLLGPSHHVAFKGIAASRCQYFQTSLGDIKLDHESIKALQPFPQFTYLEKPHIEEHCLEVQLPFLQSQLDDFLLIPLVVGHTPAEEVTEVINYCAKLPHTLIIISTDLSHFHPYEQAQAIDAETCQKILNLDSTLVGDQACGCCPLNGLLQWAKQAGLKIDNLALKNSGDSAGTKDSVVGYASYVLYE